MKTTFKEIVEASGGLSKLLDKSLRPAQAIALARLVRKLNEELALFRKEQERILASSTTPDGADAADLQKQFDELMAVEVEIDSEKVKIEVDRIDAGTVLVTEPFVIIEEAEV